MKKKRRERRVRIKFKKVFPKDLYSTYGSSGVFMGSSFRLCHEGVHRYYKLPKNLEDFTIVVCKDEPRDLPEDSYTIVKVRFFPGMNKYGYLDADGISGMSDITDPVAFTLDSGQGDRIIGRLFSTIELRDWKPVYVWLEYQ